MQELHTRGMHVHDPCFQQNYTMRVYLGLVSADTPARNALAGTLGVSAFNADWRSQWSGKRPYTETPDLPDETNGNAHVPSADDEDGGTKGMYCVGYAEETTQTWLLQSKVGDTNAYSQLTDSMYANDPRLILDDKMARLMAFSVEEGLLTHRSTGRKCMSAFAELPYFDMVWSFALPWMHAGILGVVKRFWKCLFGDVAGTSVLISKFRSEDIKLIRENGNAILVPSDITRSYACIDKYRGECI